MVEPSVVDGLVEKLRNEIGGWEQAYPLSAFPEPDLVSAAAVLKANGMTLDAISASNMRHVVGCLAPLIHEAADALLALKAEVEELRRMLGAVTAVLADYITASGEIDDYDRDLLADARAILSGESVK